MNCKNRAHDIIRNHVIINATFNNSYSFMIVCETSDENSYILLLYM